MDKYRPVKSKFVIGFHYNELYPKYLQHLTADGRHKGNDYYCPTGSEIHSPADGVLTAKGGQEFMGQYISIKFWSEKEVYRFICMHLSKYCTGKKIGDPIKKGELLALSGSSGTLYKGSDGVMRPHPHLHFEVQRYQKKVWTACDPSFLVGDA